MPRKSTKPKPTTRRKFLVKYKDSDFFVITWAIPFPDNLTPHHLTHSLSGRIDHHHDSVSHRTRRSKTHIIEKSPTFFGILRKISYYYYCVRICDIICFYARIYAPLVVFPHPCLIHKRPIHFPVGWSQLQNIRYRIPGTRLFSKERKGTVTGGTCWVLPAGKQYRTWDALSALSNHCPKLR